MKDVDTLRWGPLGEGTVHLCIDMQNLFAEATPWHTPWMERVLPVVASIAERHAERTVFTRFIPPERAEDMPGMWRAYYEAWPEITRERLAPGLIDLVPPLARLAPPARVLDKFHYSPFFGTDLAAFLVERKVDTLVVSGAETDVCVLAGVLDAVDHGFRVVLARDALCSGSDTTHDALMTLYGRRFSQQIELADAATILENWR